MPDLLSLFLAFVLGVLVSRAIPERFWFRLAWSVRQNTPRPCVKCGHWHKTRDLKSARMLWSMNYKDRYALICRQCYEIEFRPFSAVIGKSPDATKKEASHDPTDPA